MTPTEIVTVALHRIRHRISEPGYTPEPCGACRQEAASFLDALPEGSIVVSEEAWRKEQGSRTAAERRHRQGLAEGAAAERERISQGLRDLGLT